MSNSLNDIKNSFEKYLYLYTRLSILEGNYDEQYLRSKVVEIATRNRNFIDEFSKIIIKHLNTDEAKFRCRVFDIIDLILKDPTSGKDYVSKLSGNLYKAFKECFTWSDFGDRVLLFKIYYTWKYLIPHDIFKKMGEDNKIDYFKIMFIKQYPGKIEKYDEYNEKNKFNFLKNNNNINGNNRFEQASNKSIKITINPNAFNNSNNNNNNIKNSINQINNKKLIIIFFGIEQTPLF